MAARDAAKILDVGCASGGSRALRRQGHYVVGVDAHRAEGSTTGSTSSSTTTSTRVAPELDGQFDVILCADVLEHLRQPDKLLAGLHDLLAPTGTVLVSIPNFAHWYPRLRVAPGASTMTNGILDTTHLRFFTDRTFRRLAAQCGFSVDRREAVGMPFDALGDLWSRGPIGRALGVADRLSVSVYPTMFAYQYLYKLTPPPELRDGQRGDTVPCAS